MRLYFIYLVIVCYMAAKGEEAKGLCEEDNVDREFWRQQIVLG